MPKPSPKPRTRRGWLWYCTCGYGTGTYHGDAVHRKADSYEPWGCIGSTDGACYPAEVRIVPVERAKRRKK